MKFRAILLGSAALAVMAVPAVAQDAPVKHHHHHVVADGSVSARIDELEHQIQELKAEQHAQAQAAAAAPAPADQQVSAAQFEALQNQVYEQQAATATLAKSSWWGNTTLGGRVFFDLSNVENKNAGVKDGESGTHFDIKRFYLIVDHKFDDVWSANLTTDATYDTSQCNSPLTTTVVAPVPPSTTPTATTTCKSTGASTSSLYIKKAYLQGKFYDLLTVRLGGADTPWIPFVESLYGYRYIENTFIDRLKIGTSADWGAFVSGATGDDFQFEYAVSATNGAGYKKAAFGLDINRSKGMDFEGRADVKWDGFVAGIGGYDGKLGNDTAPGKTHGDATRLDGILAYVANGFRVGAEYFYTHNYDSVVVSAAKTDALGNIVSDSGDGYSGFASYQFDPSWAVFGRYDWDKPKKEVLYSPKLKNEYYNFGVEYIVTKGVNLSLVYKHDGTNDFGSISDSNGTIGPSPGSYNEIGLFGQFTF